MATIIDVSSTCGSRGAALAAAGVATVFRYYSRDTIRPSKRLSPAEAAQLSAAGLRLGIVHEGRFGDQASNFDRSCGVADGLYARRYGASQIGQPGGSGIYFGVDFDATVDDVRLRVIPYFQGVVDAFAQQTGEPQYLIGVYGSGATCEAVLSAGLAQLAWLAQSKGWRDYQKFLDSRRWALSQAMPDNIGGVACDPDKAADGVSIGDFMLTPGQPSLTQHATAMAGATAPAATPMFVNARGGLHLRSGPGTEFGILRLLPVGTLVHVLKQAGAWSSVDLQGDGLADGFVSSAFLTQDAPASKVAAPNATPLASMDAAPPVNDAMHVAELVRQGSSPDGLKAARETAANALPGYPTNGCAAHLSALLRQSGIDVPMTFGAGKLAQMLTDRGWSRITVGNQRAGDVGVCLDNTLPPGADHIYLVITAIGPDQMMIADNQRDTDEVHERFASGHGKTPTEYFLRAA